MTNKGAENKIAKFVVTGVSLASLAMLPNITFDSFNFPKMLILTLISFGALALHLSKPEISGSFKFTISKLLVVIFLANLLVIFFASKSSKFQLFYGVGGRNTGLLTTLSLLIILILGCIYLKSVQIGAINRALVICGFISTVYASLQNFGIDFFAWANEYNRIIGFLGNPNFESSFLGLTSIASLSLILDRDAKRVFRILCLIVVPINIWLIFRSDSIQGIGVIFIGFTIVVIIAILKLEIKYKAISLVFFVLTSAVFVMICILGFMNKGILAGSLHQLSNSQRLEYYRTALKIGSENPFVGVGFDSYGDWYPFYRSENALKIDGNTISTSAHSLIFDVFTTGGMPFVLIYIIAISSLIYLCLKFILGNFKFDLNLTCAIAVFGGYLFQSLISTGQIGISIWGWLYFGAIWGSLNAFRRYQDLNLSNINANFSRNKTKQGITSLSRKATAIALYLLILASVIPALVSEVRFQSAVESRNAQEIYTKAKMKPLDADKIIFAAEILANNQLLEMSEELLSFGSTKFPRNYPIAKLHYQIVSEPVDLKLRLKLKLENLSGRQFSDITS